MTKQSRDLPEYKLDAKVVTQIPWFREALLAWFHSQGRSFPWREPGRTAYEILIAEILLQRTTAGKVAQAYNAFLARYPSWSFLVQTNSEELQESLKPLGLWLQKAQVFQSLAAVMEKQNGLFPASRSELEQLPGIGQYIASAALLTLYNQPEPLIDVNMARVLERFFGPRKLADIRYDPYLQTLARNVVNIEESLQINWAILDLGALACKSSAPLCSQCPLKTECKFCKEQAYKQTELSATCVATLLADYEAAGNEEAGISETPASIKVVSSLPISAKRLSVDSSVIE